MFPMAPNTYRRERIEENTDRLVEHYMTILYYYPFINLYWQNIFQNFSIDGSIICVQICYMYNTKQIATDAFIN